MKWTTQLLLDIIRSFFSFYWVTGENKWSFSRVFWIGLFVLVCHSKFEKFVVNMLEGSRQPTADTDKTESDNQKKTVEPTTEASESKKNE